MWRIFGFGLGGDRDDGKSIGAYVFRLGDGAVSWKSQKQTSVARSVEAEYMAMCQAAKEGIWVVGPLEDFGIDLQTPLVVSGDNRGALALAQNPAFEAYRYFTGELIQAGRIIVKYIPTNIVVADALTDLPCTQHIPYGDDGRLLEGSGHWRRGQVV